MEELIFFAVIIFFSIIESIARSRKKRKAGGVPAEVERDEVEQRFEWAQRAPAELPTYDADPSYDDEQARSPGPRGRARPSSETMLPGGLLEELAGLAAGLETSKARTVRVPKQSPPLPGPEPESANLPARRAERRPSRVRSRAPEPRPSRGPPRPRSDHRLHRAHAHYGTDPSERPRSAHDTMDPLAERLSEDAKAIRAQLNSQDTSALRQAIILQEVLGKPVALRENWLED